MKSLFPDLELFALFFLLLFVLNLSLRENGRESEKGAGILLLMPDPLPRPWEEERGKSLPLGSHKMLPTPLSGEKKDWLGLVHIETRKISLAFSLTAFSV